MRHDPNRHFLYPVARPFSDDYSDNAVTADVKADHMSDGVQVSVEYKVNDASIHQQVLDSKARCVAMLYCTDTLYRRSIRETVNGNPFEITEKVPLNKLRNRVQVHPVIVANCDIETLPLHTAHPEYKGRTFSIKTGQPLAFDYPMYFNVNPFLIKLQSIFNLVTDTDGNKVQADEFEIEMDANQRYINIIADEDTMSWFQEIRSNRNVTFPSIYMSTLVAVLSYFRELEEDNGGNIPDIYPSDGWYWCIHRKLDRQSITLSDHPDKDQVSLIRAAQALLTGESKFRPFKRLLLQQRVESDD